MGTDRTSVVIVGGGLAGHRVAVSLATAEFTGTVTVVGDESHAPYNRPPLSKQFLAGTFTEEKLAFPGDPGATEWKLGSAAVGLDLDGHRVILADGSELGFDSLVIATGRRARPWPGDAPQAGVFTLRTLDDCRALRDAVSAESRVAIVGAGFIGSEAAATLHGLGVENITLIDALPAPIAPLGPELGARVAQAHRDHGIALALGTGVAGLRGSAQVEGVELADGTVVDADVVLLALGSIPNTEWTEGSGLALHGGSIVCDEHLFAAGRDDVVAVGDVAAWPDAAGGGHLSVEHWTNAREMAGLAAANLLAAADEREPYVGLPTFWSDIYDLKIKSVGVVAGAERIEIVEELPEKAALTAEAYIGTELVGAVTINDPRRMIEYTKQLTERQTVN